MKGMPLSYRMITGYRCSSPAMLISQAIQAYQRQLQRPDGDTGYSKIVKRRCPFCRKMEAQVETQLMAKLPKCRLQPFTPPFMYTSCDYFGPFKVKIGRNKTAKHYGVLFTCLNTRAVHCKLATDVSTMEFLQVLRRFFPYRGVPGSSNFRQWFPNGGCGLRTATNDRRMGQSQAKRILRRQRYEMAVYHPTCPH